MYYIQQMFKTSLILEDKRSKIQESIVDKQLDCYKGRDKITNEIKMNMVQAITNLTHVLSLIIKGEKGKQQMFLNHDSDDYNKKYG